MLTMLGRMLGAHLLHPAVPIKKTILTDETGEYYLTTEDGYSLA